MFQQIRYRLLWSYLAVLMVVLAVFAIVVRTVFARTLYYQLITRLDTLAQSVAAGSLYEAGTLQPSNSVDVQSLVNQRQALQWFDSQGQEVAQQGNELLSRPLRPDRPIQIQEYNRLLGVTVPIVDRETNLPVGYVRASETLERIDRELRTLDWGLGGGIIVALTLSGVGGIWLTRQAMRPIEHSFQRLQQFTANASHELRSPLMAIKSNAAVALKYPEGMRPADVEKFEAIANATQQMTRLTEDLLFLARNDRILVRDWESVDLAALLNYLIQLYQPEAIEQSIQLKASLPGAIWVMGDSAQLTRLFTNLIDNALHYTPAGGIVAVKAEQTVSSSGTYADIHVQDTGMGIAPEHVKHVFERFWRADRSRAHWDGGAGLGLSIAQSIAQRHNGKITVTSQVDVGSRFSVRLPTINPKVRS